MLRVFKPTSPMNIGTWILAVYAPLNFGSSASQLSGRLRVLGRLVGASAGVTGMLVSATPVH